MKRLPASLAFAAALGLLSPGGALSLRASANRLV
jgi:hypothetical protein